MKRIINKHKSKLIFLMFLFSPLFVNAIESGDDVLAVLRNITSWLWQIFLIATIIAFLIAGFFYITAAGNPEKINRANRMVLYGVIGVVVALFSGGMVALIESILESG